MTPLEVLTSILNSLWQATALAALVWLALKRLRVNAATRSVIWWAVLIVLIALPAAPRFRMLERQSKSMAKASNRVATAPAVWYSLPAEVESPSALVTLPERPAATWPLIVVAIWAAVLLFRLGRVIQSYLYLRGVKRKSTLSDFPLPEVGRSARILVSCEIASPMAVGFIHPAVILPEDLAASMTREELDQIVLHEAAHLARRDHWWNLIARLLGAVLALHPVAWWILRQIEYEREAACDDWVVARTGAARLYAETLAHIVALRWTNGDSHRGEALASGMFGRGSRIGERIETLLEAGRQFSPRVSGMRVAAGVFVLLFLAGAGSLAPRWIAFAKTPVVQRVVAQVSAIMPAAMVTPPMEKQSEPKPVLVSQAASAPIPQASLIERTTTQSKLVFEVASVKPAVPGDTGGRIQFLPGGRFLATNVPLDYLIQRIYNLRDFQVVGAPNWMAIIADGYSARYEIQAKGDESATEAEVSEMVKTLLADRFQLKVHRDTRELPVYALIPAKSGIKLAVAKDDGVPRGRNGILSMARGWIQGVNVSMPNLIQNLSRQLDRPVVDKTNFTEAFDFRLSWTPDSGPAPDTDAASPGGCPSTFAALQRRLGPEPAPTSCPSIFTAVEEQLGLKLDAQMDPTEVLVIDHVERPSAN